MKVFILEDDEKCSEVIEWIMGIFDVEYVKTIEDATSFLEYEQGIEQCDKYIFDASVQAANIIHQDGIEEAYNGALNGIDFMISCFERLGLGDKGKKVIVLSAYDVMVKNYNIPGEIRNKVQIISKNSNDLIKMLQDFLEKE